MVVCVCDLRPLVACLPLVVVLVVVPWSTISFDLLLLLLVVQVVLAQIAVEHIVAEVPVLLLHTVLEQQHIVVVPVLEHIVGLVQQLVLMECTEQPERERTVLQELVLEEHIAPLQALEHTVLEPKARVLEYSRQFHWPW